MPEPIPAVLKDNRVQRIIRWLITSLARPKVTTAADQPTKSSTVKSDNIAEDNLDSGNSDLMPDVYAEEHATTAPGLKILDQTSPDVDESRGVNPYDTAVLQKK